MVQALEFSLSKWHQGVRYELALQWQNVLSGAGQARWRYWDPSLPETDRWLPINPAIPQCLSGNEWHTLTLEGDLVNGQPHYQRFSIDDVIHTLDLTVPTAPDPARPDGLAIAVQVDGNAQATPYALVIDEVTLIREEGCAGDCDGSGDVAVNELITLVNIALGNAQPSACPHGVPNGAEVDITLIIRAVNNALNGCSG